jgi:membrane fusion protein (multidrug efflux system)
VAVLKAKLAGAQAKAKLAQAELNFTAIRAPFDGIIGRLQQQQGSLVTERESLTTLSDNSVIWTYFNVPQASYLEYMALPAQDRPVDVELILSGDRRFEETGKVAAIEAQFERETGNIAFRADFPNPGGPLRHGMVGTILLQRMMKNAIVIPQRATFEISGKRFVYVLDKEGTAQQREIAVQSEQGDDFIIKSGLDANDSVVVAGLDQIEKGQKLKYELDQR